MTTNNYSRYRRNFTPEEWLDISESFLSFADIQYSHPFDFLREKADFCEIWSVSPSYFNVIFKGWKLQEVITNKGVK